MHFDLVFSACNGFVGPEPHCKLTICSLVRKVAKQNSYMEVMRSGDDRHGPV